MSNNASEEATGPFSLVAPQEYLCHAPTEYFNDCSLFITNQTTHGPVKIQQSALNRFPPPHAVSHNTLFQLNELLTSQ